MAFAAKLHGIAGTIMKNLTTMKVVFLRLSDLVRAIDVESHTARCRTVNINIEL